MNHDHRTHVICHMTISLDGKVIDELSLVADPVIGGEGKSLCMDSRVEKYHLEELKNHDGILWMHYRRN